MSELRIDNVMMVLDDDVIHGSLRAVNGIITDIDINSGAATDYVLPGLIEIHTDALEGHLRPRPQSLWPADAAVAGDDAVLAASAITTVLDSLCVGDLGGDGFRADVLERAFAAIAAAQANGATRIDHHIHLRCEVADPRTPGLFDDLVDHPLVRLVSLMDHTPGGRQYSDLDGYRRTISSYGNSDSEIEARIHRLQERQAEHAVPNWSRIAKQTLERELPLASHDDASVEDIDLAVRSGVTFRSSRARRLPRRRRRTPGS